MKFKIVESFEKEQEKKLNEKLKSLPRVGRVDKNTGITILPSSERMDDDDFWDEQYRKEFENKYNF